MHIIYASMQVSHAIDFEYVLCFSVVARCKSCDSQSRYKGSVCWLSPGGGKSKTSWSPTLNYLNHSICYSYEESLFNILLVYWQIWVNSPHNASGYFMIYGDDSLHAEHFDSHLATGDLSTRYARTGFLGFVRRTELTQSDGGTHEIN